MTEGVGRPCAMQLNVTKFPSSEISSYGVSLDILGASSEIIKFIYELN